MGPHDHDDHHETLTIATTLRSRCGTCSHEHGPLPCPHTDCDCTAFVPHPDDIAGARTRADAEAARDDDTVMDHGTVEMILAGIQQWEGDMHQRLGWGGPTMLVGMYLADDTAAGEAREYVAASDPCHVAHLTLSPLRLPAEVWGTDPAGLLAGLAADAMRRPAAFANMRAVAGHDPARPVVGWVHLVEGTVGDDKARMVVGVDVDERIYRLNRVGDAPVTVEVEHRVPAQQRVTAEVIADGKDPAACLDDGLPVAEAALLRLMRVCVGEAAAAAAVQPRPVLVRDDPAWEYPGFGGTPVRRRLRVWRDDSEGGMYIAVLTEHYGDEGTSITNAAWAIRQRLTAEYGGAKWFAVEHYPENLVCPYSAVGWRGNRPVWRPFDAVDLLPGLEPDAEPHGCPCSQHDTTDAPPMRRNGRAGVEDSGTPSADKGAAVTDETLPEPTDPTTDEPFGTQTFTDGDTATGTDEAAAPDTSDAPAAGDTPATDTGSPQQ